MSYSVIKYRYNLIELKLIKLMKIAFSSPRKLFIRRKSFSLLISSSLIWKFSVVTSVTQYAQSPSFLIIIISKVERSWTEHALLLPSWCPGQWNKRRYVFLYQRWKHSFCGKCRKPLLFFLSHICKLVTQWYFLILWGCESISDLESWSGRSGVIQNYGN